MTGWDDYDVLADTKECSFCPSLPEGVLTDRDGNKVFFCDDHAEDAEKTQ